MVAAVQFSFQADGNRFLFLLLCVVALYVIARWASRRQEQGPADVPPEIPVSLAVGSHAFRSPDPQEVLASFPADPSLGRIRITKFFFEKLDAIPGPSDPAVFADNLNVELYDPNSDHKWWQSYLVASPQGLAQILREHSWKYLYVNEVLVLPRYDLEEIRRAVVSRIIETNEFFKPADANEETL